MKLSLMTLIVITPIHIRNCLNLCAIQIAMGMEYVKMVTWILHLYLWQSIQTTYFQSFDIPEKINTFQCTLF